MIYIWLVKIENAIEILCNVVCLLVIVRGLLQQFICKLGRFNVKFSWNEFCKASCFCIAKNCLDQAMLFS